MKETTPGIKIPYLRIDHDVPTTTRCVEIRIPNDDSFLPVLAGLIAQATKWFNYERDATHKASSLAAIWRKAYFETDWGQCMNCEELQACIQPLLNAMAQQIIQSISSNTTTPYPQGEPLPGEELERDLTEGMNPECDLNIIWAQSLQCVQYSTTLITDVLEAAESATNRVELVDTVLDSVPGGEAIPGLEGIGQYINLLLEGVAENFAAQITQEYIEQFACDILCLARAQCKITLDIIWQVCVARMEEHFGSPSSTLSTIGDLMIYLLDQSIESTTVADAMMGLFWGGGVLANIFMGEIGVKPLEIVLALAVNDANNDWELLCTCPNCDDVFTIVIGTDNLPTSIISVVMQVQPLGTELPPTYWARRIVLTASQPVSSWEFDYNYGGGATGDPLTWGFSTGVGELPEQTGHAVLTTDTPATSLIIDLGYSGSEHAYDDSPMFLSNVIWCE